MNSQMKLIINKALILPPSITKRYLKEGIDDDETVTILTLSEDPLCIVAVTVKIYTVMERCPYNFFYVDDTVSSQVERGRALSCTGSLLHIITEKVTLPNYDYYTFFSIYVDDDESITFHEEEVPLDNNTKELVKVFSYSIYTSRSEIEDEYHSQEKLPKEENDKSNDASSEDNLDDDFPQPVNNKHINKKRRKSQTVSTPPIIDEVDELEEDTDKENEKEQVQNVDNTMDDDDFQEPILVKPRYSLRQCKKNNKKAPTQKVEKRATRSTSSRSKQSDNDKPQRKNNEPTSGLRRSSRSSTAKKKSC